MNLLSSISWTDFLTVSVIILLLFNIAVVVYYQAFYKGEKKQDFSNENKFNPTAEEKDEENVISEDDEQEVMFVSMTEEETIEDDNTLPLESNETNEEESFTEVVPNIDNKETNEEESEEVPDIDINDEELLIGVNADTFFDGEPLSGEDYEVAEMAFQSLGFETEESDLELEIYNEDLVTASISTINVDASQLEREDELFLEIVEKLAEIEEKEQEEELNKIQTTEEVNDNFFGEQDL